MAEQVKLKDLPLNTLYKVTTIRTTNHEKFGRSLLMEFSDYVNEDSFTAYLPKRYARELSAETIDLINSPAEGPLLFFIEKHANNTSYLRFQWEELQNAQTLNFLSL